MRNTLNAYIKSSSICLHASVHAVRFFVLDHFIFVFFNFFIINHYELMALFTFPLLLEFSVDVEQNTTHVFVMRSRRASYAFVCVGSVAVCRPT